MKVRFTQLALPVSLLAGLFFGNPMAAMAEEVHRSQHEGTSRNYNVNDSTSTNNNRNFNLGFQFGGTASTQATGFPGEATIALPNGGQLRVPMNQDHMNIIGLFATSDVSVASITAEQRLSLLSAFINEGLLDQLVLTLDPDEDPDYYVSTARAFLQAMVSDGSMSSGVWRRVQPLLSGSTDTDIARSVFDYYWELKYQSNRSPELTTVQPTTTVQPATQPVPAPVAQSVPPASVHVAAPTTASAPVTSAPTSGAPVANVPQEHSSWLSASPTAERTNAVYLDGTLVGYCSPNAGDIRALLGGATYEGGRTNAAEQAAGVWYNHRVSR